MTDEMDIAGGADRRQVTLLVEKTVSEKPMTLRPPVNKKLCSGELCRYLIRSQSDEGNLEGVVWRDKMGIAEAWSLARIS
jgi:hypothetical protein